VLSTDSGGHHDGNRPYSGGYEPVILASPSLSVGCMRSRGGSKDPFHSLLAGDKDVGIGMGMVTFTGYKGETTSI